MRRYLGWIAIGWLLALCAVALVAYGRPASHPSLDARTREVALQLRCLVCQGESVADSPSGLAQEMRGVIRRKLADGWSEDQVKAYFVSRYGQRILLAPSRTGLGSVAWLGPPLLVLGGLGLLVTLAVDWRSRGRDTGVKDEDIYLARVRAELAARGNVPE